jgi:L-alanine-DL-glutamate epimerase-like enolase superfamily enzyme
MTFTLLDTRFHVLPMRTRFPFKYGIASMSALPHLFVAVDLELDGREVTGIASEGLPPKWFTKNPQTLFEDDLAEMISVIQNAARIARIAAARGRSFFPWWRDLADEMALWGKIRGLPPLLINLGISLIERAVIDGLAKAAAQPLHVLLRSPVLGIDLGAVRPELRRITVAEVLAKEPLSTIDVRHTVGLGDPLRGKEIPEQDQLNDGLPFGLDESIRTYGLTYFKIKVSGRPDVDLPRLREITSVLSETCPQGFHATLDGNEQFEDLPSFLAFYETLRADAALAPLFRSLLLIEQPLHRAKALEDDVAGALASWRDGPGIIIDEADGSLDDLPRALDLGYAGASHKNCKGIVKGIANAALLKVRASKMARPPILSGEDLANVGPVALLQDLAMMAALGISHVERNGHHYFRGLSMCPENVQEQVLAAHPDLYRRHESGFPTLDIRAGRLQLNTVNQSPFGSAVSLDVRQFTDLKSWIHSGGMTSL